MVELSGSLAGVDLVPMLRLLSELRQTGSLQLARDGWSARLDLRDGRVVGAAFADERGLNALTALGLVLHDAEFVYTEGPSPGVQDLDLTPDGLGGYLEAGAHMGVLSLDAVPRRTGDGLAEVDEDEVVLHRSTVQQLLAIDGRRTVGELVGERPNSTVMLDLARLLELGLIRIEDRSYVDLGDGQLAASATPPLAASRLEHVNGQVSGPRVCPHLGFADDPASRYERPTAIHRCYANGSRSAVSTLEQRQYCLNADFERCPRLRPMLDAPKARALDGIESRPMGLPAGPTAPPAPARAPRPLGDRILPAVSLTLTVLAVVALFLAFVRPRLTTPSDSEQATIVIPRAEVAPTIPPTPPVQPTVRVVPTAPAAVVQATTAPTTTAPITNAPPTNVPPTNAPATTAPTTQAPPTPAPTAAPLSADGPLLDAQFSTQQPSWPEQPPFAAWSNGAYRLSAREANHFVAVAAPTTPSLRDIVVQATLRKVAGPPGGGYGLIVRDQQPDQRNGAVQDGQFYVFEVGDRGEFGIWRRDGDRWIDLKTWTPSPLVRSGNATNDLAVQIVADRMTFLVNGQEVATEVDSALMQGGVGLFIGGDGNEVAVDRFTVTGPAETPQ